MQNLSFPAAVLPTTLLILGGCTTTQVNEVSDIPTEIQTLQGVALVFSHDARDVEREASDCIRAAIESEQLRVRIVSADEFRRTAFPDLQPEAAVHSSEYLAVLLNDQRFRDRIASLGIRYLISITGVTEEGLVGAGAGSMAGLMVWDRRTQLSASVLDLAKASLEEDIRAHATGNPWLLNVGGLPLYIPAATESQACQDLGGAVVRFLKKDRAEP